MIANNIGIDFEKSIGPLLGKTVKLMDYYLQERINEQGLDLTKEQIIVLKILSIKDGIAQNELACQSFRDKSSLTRLLAKMEKKKYIKRKQCKKDRRINNVYITALGEEVFSKAKPLIKTLISTIEEDITSAQKTQIIELLKKIQTNIGSKL